MRKITTIIAIALFILNVTGCSSNKTNGMPKNITLGGSYSSLEKNYKNEDNDSERFFDISDQKLGDLKVDYEHWKLISVHNDYDYLKQIFLGQDVEIRTHILKIGNSSFTLGQEAWQDGQLKVKGTCVLVHFDFMEQKSVPIPDDIRLQLEEHLIPADEFGKE